MMEEKETRDMYRKMLGQEEQKQENKEQDQIQIQNSKVLDEEEKESVQKEGDIEVTLQGIDGEMEDHQEVTEQLEEQLLEKQNEINKLKKQLEE